MSRHVSKLIYENTTPFSLSKKYSVQCSVYGFVSILFFGIVWRFEHLRYVSNWEIVVCWIAGTLETMKETDCLREKRFGGGGVVLIIFPTGKMNSRYFSLEKILYSMLLFPIMPWPVYWTSIYKSVSKKHNIHIYALLLVFWKQVNRSDSLCSRVAKS